ncbi:GNAT family N-acetyltransferase/peptidase C39 family protein [Methylocaldum sp.]|uniref:GNAT family N-acetyltransferase/peptidase C39 family protein n=1 Tax=Methylocaldum sp. TaxID=1969727 RepID=UPI002D530B6A|nr:GNAT family N-acetyltransferase/peptidase C39 family protein [Methylocaldum sp.]HYE34737.1 GNAT family N-acetyltransferase/peptidase C39 family protein [Methylocaldum sp.]
MIRAANLDDLDALVRIEDRCFDIDRISRRNFRYLLTKANATTVVDVQRGIIRGYSMVLFHTGTSLARLYSYAVDTPYRGQGIGRNLVEASEGLALDRECVTLRLEVRRDNLPSIKLFEGLGYRYLESVPDYYEDHASALRFEKMLAPHLNPELARVPYYQQTLDFTCGPASLMMAMRTLQTDLELHRKLELRIWRESTTVFMTSGHGGCGPYGLALSAYHRGFDVEVFVNDEGALFITSVRDPEKREVMQVVQEDFLDELKKLPVKIVYGALNYNELQEKMEQGGIPVVLISSYRLYQEKFPHWIVVTGFDEHYFYVHDPYVDYAAGKTSTDCINMPIHKKDFQRMARYGKTGQKSVLILRKAKSRRRH